MAFGDHLRAGFEPIENFHFARCPLTQLDLGQAGTAILDPVDEKIVTTRHDRLLRNQDGVFALTQHDRNAGKHARPESTVRIGDATTHQDRASGFIDRRIECLNLAMEPRLRIGIDLDRDGLSNLEER